MHQKERLLSFDVPVAFIFSHSALKEGWDNPNVFQICTLNQTSSIVRKRQEVGRGVRLAVDKNGDRVKEPRHNILTVVPNESYAGFVAGLQSEVAMEFRAEIEARYGKSIENLSDEDRAKIAEEYGEGILPPKPEDARKRDSIKLNKAHYLDPKFKDLWERVKHKTRYSVKIDTEKLISDVVDGLSKEQIRPPRIQVQKVLVDATDENEFVALQVSGARSLQSLANRYPLPNLVDLMTNLLEYTTPPVRLTRKTLLEIIKRAPNQQVLVDSPQEFASVTVRLIKEKISDQLISGIEYHKTGEWYRMELFEKEEEIQAWQDHLIKAEKSVYDGVVWESSVEKAFVEGLERHEAVQLYVKLPDWFTVPTPIGTYNPDWAIVWEERDEHGNTLQDKPFLYLVRETKSTLKRDDLHPDERRKIECGERHFRDALGVSYEVITSTEQLPFL